MAGRVSDAAAQPFGVPTGLVHADQANRGEVIVEAAQVGLGIRIQAFVQQTGDELALRVQAAGGHVHQPGQTGIEFIFILGQIGQPGHVQCDDTDGAGGFARTEITAGFLAQFA